MRPAYPAPRSRLCCGLAVASLFASGSAFAGTPTTFPAGSIVVPMDTDLQNEGILDAYGMVYEMLRRGIHVSWVIDGDKVVGGVDMTVASHLSTAAPTTASSHAFRGGPWVIAAQDAAAAQAVITQWQAVAAHDAVAYVTTESFVGEVSRNLYAAPSIVIYEDGNEDIAWAYLNAAGIVDLDGRIWDENSAYNLSDPELVGPDANVAGDGALFDEDGVVNYCHLNAMHYDVADGSPVAREFRRFAEDPLVSFLTECEASVTLENDPVAGSMLSTGITKVGLDRADAVVTIDHPSDELVQIDGPWELVGGSMPDFTGTFDPGVRFMSADDGDNEAKLLAYGHLDDDMTKGKVAFLGGHEYSTDLPYATHPELNGVRVFLNSYFTARCTELADAPIVSIDGDPEADVNDITLTLDWGNDGVSRGRDGELVLQLPPGITYVSDDSGGVYDPVTNTVTWDLGTLASGEHGTITLELVAAADGVDTLEASLRYRVEATWFEVDWTEDVAHGVDTDDDGSPDVVEDDNGTDPNDPDSDDDGLSDGDEIIEDSDPLDPDTDDDGLNDGDEVDEGTDVTDPDTDDDGVDDGDEIVDETDPLDPDTDDDGLDDGEEDTAGTDPLDTDSDDDGLSDGTEPDLGLDPLDPDSDDDGLDDGDEVDVHETDPLDPDTDDDGVSDGDEVEDGTDPLDADTDDDGLTDGEEDTLGTDPLDSDTDDDGLSDGEEVDTYGTDPVDADTDDGGVSDGEEVHEDGTDPLDGSDDVLDPDEDTDGDGLTNAEEADYGTDPLDPDTDDGGVEDGKEVHEDGTDPLDGSDDLVEDDIDGDEWKYFGRGGCGCETRTGPTTAWGALAVGLATLIRARRRAA